MAFATTATLILPAVSGRPSALARVRIWWQRQQQDVVLRQVDPRLCEDAGLRRPAGPARAPIRLPL